MLTNLLWEETKRFDAWQAAKNFLCTLKGQYVFRGMSNAEWNLETTLDRKVHYHRSDSEKILIDSFQRAVPPSVHNAPRPDDLFSWRALMRHYGLPSRLLDCTESPCVAAYFSVQYPPDSDCDFAIWAIDRNALQRSAEVSLGILSQGGPPLSPLEVGDLFSAAFNHSKRFVALVDAKHKSPRQKAQQGLFLCPGDPDYPFWRNLHGIPAAARTPGFMYKVVLPGSVRKEVLDDLQGQDINQAHLLPSIDDIEKLCTRLGELLAQSQNNLGHFQWKVAVKPVLTKYGLLEIGHVGLFHGRSSPPTLPSRMVL